MAEGQVSLYKNELVRNRGPWRDVDDLELDTLEQVTWFNQTRFMENPGTSHPSSTRWPTTLIEQFRR